MAPTTIEARCNARPTRLAFILPNPDRDLLLKVIARATTLWGGIFNPIVILDDSTRDTSGVHYTMLPPAPYKQLQADMISAFDPDLLIRYSNDPLPPEPEAMAASDVSRQPRKHRLGKEVRGAVKKSLKDYRVYNQPANPKQVSERAEDLISRAIEAAVFRVGLEFQCSRCKRYHWYSVTEFSIFSDRQCSGLGSIGRAKRQVEPGLVPRSLSAVSETLRRCTVHVHDTTDRRSVFDTAT